MTDFLEIDFCKQRTLRINRRFNVSEGLESEDLAGATSLGCRFPVSHRANGPGFILSRVDKQTGKKVSDLLFSPNEILPTSPGPTAWLSGCPVKALNGSAATDFPANEPLITLRLFQGVNEIQLPPQAIGLGTVVGFRRLLLLPPGNLEYLDPGALANHSVRYYFACVSSPNATEAFRLTYATVIAPNGTGPRYVWQGVPGQGTQVQQNGQNNWSHFIGVSLVGTPPALVGHESLVLTPPTAVSTSPQPGPNGTNGPDQTNRKFSYQHVGDAVNPGFNQSQTLDFPLERGRPTLTMFAQSEFFDNFGGFETFTINGSPVTFSTATIPADQYATRPFIQQGGGAPNNFFESGTFTISSNPAIQGMLHGPADMAAQLNIPVDVDELDFQIRTADNPGGVISTFTLPIPKPVNRIAWVEGLVSIWSRHVGSL